MDRQSLKLKRSWKSRLSWRNCQTYTEIHEIQSKLADVLVARTHSEVALANHWGGTFKISAILGNWVTTSQWEYAAHSITFGSGLWSYEKKEKNLKNLGFGFGFGWNWVSIETETFGFRRNRNRNQGFVGSLDRKLQVFKNSPKWTFFGILN